MTARVTKSEVVFNEPIEIELLPPRIKMRGEDLSTADINEIVYDLKARGFDENAIVVRRALVDFARKQFYHWGVICNVVRYKNHMTKGYNPLVVLWFNDGKRLDHWDDELLIVHDHMTDRELLDSFEYQLKPKDPV